MELSAIANDGLADELEGKNALLMTKLKYIAQLELELDQLRLQCHTLDDLRVERKGDGVGTNHEQGVDQGDQVDQGQEVQRLSQLLQEKSDALARLKAELERRDAAGDQQQDKVMQQLQEENSSLAAQVDRLGRGAFRAYHKNQTEGKANVAAGWGMYLNATPAV